VAGAAMIVLAVPAFQLIKAHGTWPPILGVLLLATLLACFAAPSAATLPALFPTAVRYAAMGIGFNFAVSAFGGTTPLVTAALVTATGDDLMPAYYLMLAGVIGLLTVKFLPETAQVPLKGSQPMVGSREERGELITVSRELYAFVQQRDGARRT
jgi:MHS family proline/betaine transporter-like MFS transporter